MINCNIHSLYLCVFDMERAIAFYEDFFEKSMNHIVSEITVCRVLKLRMLKHYIGNYAG